MGEVTSLEPELIPEARTHLSPCLTRLHFHFEPKVLDHAACLTSANHWPSRNQWQILSSVQAKGFCPRLQVPFTSSSSDLLEFNHSFVLPVHLKYYGEQVDIISYKGRKCCSHFMVHGFLHCDGPRCSFVPAKFLNGLKGPFIHHSLSSSLCGKFLSLY